MKIWKSSLFLAIFFLLITGCSTENQETEPSHSSSPIAAPISTTPSQPTSIIAGDLVPFIIPMGTEGNQVKLKLGVKNQTEKEQPLTFTSGQQFEYSIQNEKGEVIRTYSENKRFIQSIQEKVLKQGEELAFEETLDALEDGKYTLYFQLLAQGKELNANYHFELPEKK